MVSQTKETEYRRPKSIPYSGLEMFENDTLLERHIPIWLIYGSTPPPFPPLGGYTWDACWRVHLFCTGCLSRMQLNRSWLRGRAHGPCKPVSDWSESKHGLRTNVQPRHVVSLRNRGYSRRGWRYRMHNFSWPYIFWMPRTDQALAGESASMDSRSQRAIVKAVGRRVTDELRAS